MSVSYADSGTVMRTLLIDIMLAMRVGFGERRSEMFATHYTGESLVSLIRWTDGKLYRIEIKPVGEESDKSDGLEKD